MIPYISAFFAIFKLYRLDLRSEYELYDLVSPTTVTSSLISSPSDKSGLECRVQWDLEKRTNLIDRWVELDLPILTSVVRDDRAKKQNPIADDENWRFYKNLKEDMVYITLTQNHVLTYGQARGKEVALDFKKIPWMCIYGRRESEDGQTHDWEESAYHEFAMHVQTKKPVFIINLMCNHTRMTGY